MNIPDNDNEGFFRYNWFNSHMQEISMEWDSLVIIPQSKMIINIEVKSGKGINPQKKAASQANIHLTIFKKIFGSLLSAEWKFVKAVFTPNLELNEGDQPCEACKHFILQQEDCWDMKPWINNLMNSSVIYVDDIYTEYDNLLVEIIGFSSIRQSDHLNKLIIHPKELSEETERKLTNQASAIQGENEMNRNKLKEAYEAENYKSEYLCYMLTHDQLMAVKDPSTHIIIEGDYGCGKTYVLKERTKQCAEKFPESKIAYINITTDGGLYYFNKNMMDIIAENNFKDYNNVDIVTATHLKDHYSKYRDQLKGISDLNLINGDECSLLLKHFLEHSTYDHIFIEEMPPFKETNSNHDFFLRDKSFCVTMKCGVSGINDNEEWIIQMVERYNAKRIILKHNMRNSQTIMNLLNCFVGIFFSMKNNLPKANVIPNKNIIGPVCYHYQNNHRLDKHMLARAAIHKYFPQQKESLVVLVNFNTQSFYTELQEYFTTTRNIVYLTVGNEYGDNEKFISEVKECLEDPEGILITDTRSFQGAQARNIISIADNNWLDNDFHLRNMILRTMSFAIIIHDEDNGEQSVPGLVRDDNLHEHADPGSTEQIFCHSEYAPHRSNCHLPFKEQNSDLAVSEDKEDEISEDTEED